MNNLPENPRSPFRAPSARMTAALAAAMLAVGVAVGAAIGPAPSPSQADPSLPLLIESLARAAAARATATTPATVQPSPPPSSTEATPTRTRRRRARKRASADEAPSAANTTPTSETETTPTSTQPKSTTKASTLPPVTHVWLIELAGTSFTAASAQPTTAPYIDTQAIPAGTLLSGWSGLDGSVFANDATLIASTPPQLLDTIVQPACPASISASSSQMDGDASGAPDASCATEAGALTAADEFLKATIPTITSTAAFRENGLIVVTFASIAAATATGLPAGAATATLTSRPPAGVLLISPFAKAGAKSSLAFTPTSPKQGLERLLRR
jgi:hypothetical protein